MFTTLATHNPMKDIEVSQPPEDSISKIVFSPNSNYLVGSSWNNTIRCWEIQDSASAAKAEQQHSGPVLDCCWHSDGTKVLSASCDKTCKVWDLQCNQAMNIGVHEAPIRCVRWIQAPHFNGALTGGWDKKLKFWDIRAPKEAMSIQLPERCYCMDVMYPVAVVGTAARHLLIYSLEGTPSLFRSVENPLKYQHRCITIFKEKQGQPTGFAIGSIEGRVAIQHINPNTPSRDNFTFKCHRSVVSAAGQVQDIFAVNDIAFHPSHNTLATVGSDGRFSFWDKDARTKLKTSEAMEQSITSCSFSHNGSMFAYSVSYDWSKGHEYFNPSKKNCIFLRAAMEELKPRNKGKR